MWEACQVPSVPEVFSARREHPFNGRPAQELPRMSHFDAIVLGGGAPTLF
jgi:hypothetical protein